MRGDLAALHCFDHRSQEGMILKQLAAALTSCMISLDT